MATPRVIYPCTTLRCPDPGRHPCRGPAMANARCRMHGGKSTGPRTSAGIERCRTAPLKHGRRSPRCWLSDVRWLRKLRSILSETAALEKRSTNSLGMLGLPRNKVCPVLLENTPGGGEAIETSRTWGC